MAIAVVEVLNKKRMGYELSDEEVDGMVKAFSSGTVPDYQLSAFLMAVCCNGMTPRETAVLTRAMKESGVTADLTDIPTPKVDKHSTGGVGDKTSLILAPICGSLGFAVPMMSGRGLGHTGGTLDKLESIPNFHVSLGIEQFKEVLKTVGVAIVGTTADMAPADKKMYALRDVTGTVASLPLITGSIMCKKLAENPDSLVLDVKTGAGAFMAKEEDAIALAKSMIAAGEGDGKATTAFVTSMDQPLGRAVGNWLEVAESVRVLRGGAPSDLTEVSVTLAAQMLLQASRTPGGEAKRPRSEFANYESARRRACEQLKNGEALANFRAMVVAQFGDPHVIDDFSTSHHGPETATLFSGAKSLEVYQAVFGVGEGKPVPLKDVSSSGEAAHGCFWGPPCQGLEKCRSLETFFRRAEGTDLPPEGIDDSGTSVERSRSAPNGPVVARVQGINALEVGLACIGIGAGRKKLGEALSLGSGLLLHKKVGDDLRQGDVLFTLFAEVGSIGAGLCRSRRVIELPDVDAACARVIGAYDLCRDAAELAKPAKASKLIRCFVDRDGSVTRL